MILENVSKSFDSEPVLHSLSLRLTPGHTHALIGPSGCGKTTLLKLMIGLLWPDRGTIEFDGVRLQREKVRPWRLQFGYVIQDGGLFPHLTARQNICLMAEILGRDTSTLDRRVAELAELTHFPQDALGRYPAQLSGGQRQRVSIMRALMLDPKFLLLDEPLSALDPMIRAELQRELKQIFSELGKTVVLVTHDLFEASFFAHEVVLLNEGRIVQHGTPQELIDRPANEFAKKFVSAQQALTGGSS